MQSPAEIVNARCWCSLVFAAAPAHCFKQVQDDAGRPLWLRPALKRCPLSAPPTVHAKGASARRLASLAPFVSARRKVRFMSTDGPEAGLYGGARRGGLTWFSSMTKDILESDIDLVTQMIKADHGPAEIVEALLRRGVDPIKASQLVEALRSGKVVPPDLYATPVLKPPRQKSE